MLRGIALIMNSDERRGKGRLRALIGATSFARRQLIESTMFRSPSNVHLPGISQRLHANTRLPETDEQAMISVYKCLTSNTVRNLIYASEPLAKRVFETAHAARARYYAGCLLNIAML